MNTYFSLKAIKRSLILISLIVLSSATLAEELDEYIGYIYSFNVSTRVLHSDDIYFVIDRFVVIQHESSSSDERLPLSYLEPGQVVKVEYTYKGSTGESHVERIVLLDQMP